MKANAAMSDTLRNDRKTWFITGVTGFIGSNLPAKRFLLVRQEVKLNR